MEVRRCPSVDEWVREVCKFCKVRKCMRTMEYSSTIKRNTFESVLKSWMKLNPIIQSKVRQKEKDKYCILTNIYGILKNGSNSPSCWTAKQAKM